MSLVRDTVFVSETRGGANMLTTLDLFCGAGGITEGFRQAGFTCLYGNDIAEWAIRTFAHNHPNAVADGQPIENADPADIRAQVGLKPGQLSVLVGGPPCQGFSINAPERFLSDPRNALFKHYMRFVDEFKPRTVVFENVPGMLSLGDGHVFDQIMAEFRRHGYDVRARILFAAHYGVPQERWRLIILGAREGSAPLHPEPTHFASGRANFTGSRELTFRLDSEDRARLRPQVTVGDAIGDLPRLKIQQGTEISSYDKAPHSEYAKAMRNDEGVLYNHVSGRLSRQNIERMQYIKPGGSWRDIPFELLPKGMQRAKRSDHTRRYGRLRADGLAATIMTKCDPHWGPVFLPDQDRALTVREAARIQSFPDKYRFLGPRVAQYEQVGNAVPVLLAKAIANCIQDHFNTE
jgi:DNA (cytosine-5)-methyltransferase 1